MQKVQSFWIAGIIETSLRSNLIATWRPSAQGWRVQPQPAPSLTYPIRPCFALTQLLASVTMVTHARISMATCVKFAGCMFCTHMTLCRGQHMRRWATCYFWSVFFSTANHIFIGLCLNPLNYIQFGWIKNKQLFRCSKYNLYKYSTLYLNHINGSKYMTVNITDSNIEFYPNQNIV